MSPLVQNALAIAACLAAAAFVGWRAWRALKGRAGGCGTGCSSCPSSQIKGGVTTAKALMSIEGGPEEGLQRASLTAKKRR